MGDDSPEGVADEEGDREIEGADRSRPASGGVCRPGVNRLSTPGLDDQASRSAERAVRDATGADARVAETTGEGARAAAEATGPADDRVETRLRWEGPGNIVYEPQIVRTTPDRFQITAKRERRGAIPWGFWGAIIFFGVAAIAIVGAGNFYSLWDFLWVLIGLSVGAALYQFGRRSTLEELVLCTVDERRRLLEWPEGAQSGLGEMVAGFDDITEVVFGMTTLPVDEGQPDVRVDAFALLVRTTDDELVPVVEGSPYKGGVHEVAQFLAEVTETELTYVGRGVDG